MSGTPGSQPQAGLSPTAANRAVDGIARAAVEALVRALDLHDPALGQRAAYRAAVVHHSAAALGLEPDVCAAAIGGALLAELSALVAHARADDTDVAGAVLSASLAERAGAGPAITAAIRTASNAGTAKARRTG